MLAGALLLLALGIARGQTDLPRWVDLGGQAIGYVVLAVGFYRAMKTRNEIQEEREK